MKRTIIKIDEEKCNGCGLCVQGCHEGALQLVDGKARMISELYCDGLGACIGECPEGAISLEEREAEDYDEIKTIERIAQKGENTILAHLNHLIEHKQDDYFKIAIQWLQQNDIQFDKTKLKFKTHKHQAGQHSGCPGSMAIHFKENNSNGYDAQMQTNSQPSELRQWPIQLHLINPAASYFINSDVLIAADCTAFAMGNFHKDYLKNKSLVIACPKLDSNKEIYVDKIATMIEQSKINTITVLMMEVPCCGGLLQLVKMAQNQAKRKVPVKAIVVGLQGNILSENWI